jgi:NADPH-dependent curcumin reductase CurA
MDIKQIVLAGRPNGVPTQENFRTEAVNLQELKSDEVLIKGLFYSVDPYMRGRMNDVKSYSPPFQVDAPISGGVVGEVEESKSADYKKGDIVLGMLPWATQSIVSSKEIRKIDTSLAPASYYLGILGMPGLTAYFGLIDIGKPKSGDTVGIAGSDDKISMLKDEFHFDEVINYKATANIGEAIKKACPDGVDIYFDNVGGEISDAVIANINFHARIVLCGQISLYNSTERPVGPRLQPMLLTRSVLMQGFIVSNYQSRFPEGIVQLSQWVKEGKLTYKETIMNGFDQLPQAFIALFAGTNTGKMIVKA